MDGPREPRSKWAPLGLVTLWAGVLGDPPGLTNLSAASVSLPKGCQAPADRRGVLVNLSLLKGCCCVLGFLKLGLGPQREVRPVQMSSEQLEALWGQGIDPQVYSQVQCDEK